MNLFGLLQVSGSALTAERLRAEVVTSNLANSETTHTAEGGPYRRQMVSFQPQSASPFHLLLAHSLNGPGGAAAAGGVKVSQVLDDPSPPERRYQPGHPDADASGYVDYPAINPVQEMVDLMGAERAYELNASAVQAAKQMIQQSLQILK
jgi:flagellar basal-body rod protein FlgC